MTRRKKKGYWYKPPGPFSGTWAKSHPEFCHPKQPLKIKVDAYYTISVWNEYFSANCRWKCSMGTWICIEAPWPVEWMKGMDKATAKLEIARMGLNYTWISNASPTQEARAAGPTTATGSEGALQITRHENLTGGPDRATTGEGVASRNGPTLTGSTAESLSLQTGSLRGSSFNQKQVESSSASVHQGSPLDTPVPTAVGPTPETEEQTDTHKSVRVKPSQGQLTQSIQAY